MNTLFIALPSIQNEYETETDSILFLERLKQFCETNSIIIPSFNIDSYIEKIQSLKHTNINFFNVDDTKYQRLSILNDSRSHILSVMKSLEWNQKMIDSEKRWKTVFDESPQATLDQIQGYENWESVEKYGMTLKKVPSKAKSSQYFYHPDSKKYIHWPKFY